MVQSLTVLRAEQWVSGGAGPRPPTNRCYVRIHSALKRQRGEGRTQHKVVALRLLSGRADSLTPTRMRALEGLQRSLVSQVKLEYDDFLEGELSIEKGRRLDVQGV